MTLQQSPQTVGVGTTVEIERDGETEKWQIAREGESDIAAGVIASNAPLARALLGAASGETRSFQAGDHEWTVSVRAVTA
jgi:transcription elongation GreA/GreB family factor